MVTDAAVVTVNVRRTRGRTFMSSPLARCTAMKRVSAARKPKSPNSEPSESNA